MVCLRWLLPVRAVKPTAREQKKLETTSTNILFQKYSVWRRSSILTAIPGVIVSLAFNYLSLFENDLIGSDSVLNYWGQFCFLFAESSQVFMLIGAIAALLFWVKIHFSMRVLRIGWIIGTLAPFLPAFFPLEFTYQRDVVSTLSDANKEIAGLIFAFRYAFQLFPVVVTFPAGAIRASLRVRHMLPSSSIPGWVLIIAAPFYSIVVVVAFAILAQVAGDGFLLAGSFLIAVRPLIFLLRSDWLVEIRSEQLEAKIRVLVIVSNILGIIGAALLVVWAVDTLEYGTEEVARFVVETFSRFVATTVVFSDSLTMMAVQNRRIEHRRQELDGPSGHADLTDFSSAFPEKNNDVKEKDNNAHEKEKISWFSQPMTTTPEAHPERNTVISRILSPNPPEESTEREEETFFDSITSLFSMSPCSGGNVSTST